MLKKRIRMRWEIETRLLSQMFGRELVLGEVKVQLGMKRMWVKVMVIEQKRTRARKPGDRVHGDCT